MKKKRLYQKQALIAQMVEIVVVKEKQRSIL